jgi:large subunit ribosomal protein L22
MMEAKATARFVRVSPRKARLLVDLIRGRQVEEALNLLHFNKKAAAHTVEKTLRSAVANLMHKHAGDSAVPPEQFVVTHASVDDGATMKRWRPKSMGRAGMILKRSSHITIRVSDGQDAVGAQAD